MDFSKELLICVMTTPSDGWFDVSVVNVSETKDYFEMVFKFALSTPRPPKDTSHPKQTVTVFKFKAPDKRKPILITYKGLR